MSCNYICPSCSTVHDLGDVYSEDFEFEVDGYLSNIDDLGPLGAYGEGSIGDVDCPLTRSCKECGELIEINVVVTATPVYTDYESETKMPNIEYFKDIEIKEVRSQDTSSIQTGSLMECFKFNDWNDSDDYLPDIGEYDSTEDELNLLIIVKTRMNNGYCFIGWDMINGGLVRPILRTATNQCCWQKTDPVLDVGQQHRFKVHSYHLKEIPFPHKSDDVLVSYLERIPAEEMNIFYLLGAMSCNRMEDVFNRADLKESRYVIEGEECPSVGIYICSGKNLKVYDRKSCDGKIRKRCKIIEGELTFEFPITALQPHSPTNRDVLVIMGLARPFTGNGKFTPARCYIMVLGIIPDAQPSEPVEG